MGKIQNRNNSWRRKKGVKLYNPQKESKISLNKIRKCDISNNQKEETLRKARKCNSSTTAPVVLIHWTITFPVLVPHSSWFLGGNSKKGNKATMAHQPLNDVVNKQSTVSPEHLHTTTIGQYLPPTYQINNGQDFRKSINIKIINVLFVRA